MRKTLGSLFCASNSSEIAVQAGTLSVLKGFLFIQSKSLKARSTTVFAIANDDVHAGEGALRTLRTIPEDPFSKRKFPMIFPESSIATAWTPAQPWVVCSTSNFGQYLYFLPKKLFHVSINCVDRQQKQVQLNRNYYFWYTQYERMNQHHSLKNVCWSFACYTQRSCRL